MKHYALFFNFLLLNGSIVEISPAVADSLLYFLKTEDPRVQLGEAWATMLEARALYELELERCRTTVEAVDWRSATVADAHLRCDDCGSDLVTQTEAGNTDQAQMALVCDACGATPSVEAAILEAVSRAPEAEAYIRMKDSAESGPVFECPACGEEAYIDFERGCAPCGEAFEWENCMVCHSRIPIEDALAGFDEGICSYCSHIAAKDD
jgi:DNA-directed RNA polymerase subunit M/transcription elongation factor TFIIS